MKINRIYQPGTYQPGDTVDLSPSAGQHVSVVLRMKPGEHLTLFRGNNYEYHAVIVSAQKRQVTVQIQSHQKMDRESFRMIHLAQSISKGERMEWVIQKAVELGVSTITPLISERTVVRVDENRLSKKLAQWQAIAIAACEQCGRNSLPTLHPITVFQDYIQQTEAELKLLLDPESEKTWRDFDFEVKDITLLIGPEGGFSQNEIDLARAHQFQGLKLGPRILRTETAAISALSMLQAVSGDL
ncbi:16S rRNA (uracil(1498)-N(3))-methyltransferase [Legionella impletisoli]|uniref:Ribosomal RNA small subunit methyltransferase E n=1 Tax=Legionella impletisoli TaxID=343510 RepID=A0A917JU18_9GAMM|nr:16S rRNA (uracil(1498)-N(3))-methyltransferase [Legionella impletisoli]GGI84820.1 ribosomal RNA small subunit methyltransferase E [Legionella impletisoli]